MKLNTLGSPGREILDLHDDPEAIPASVLLATVPVGVITYEADGRCTSANEAAAEVLGVSRERLLEQNFRHLCSWVDSGLLAHAEATLQDGHPFEGRLPITTASGRELCLEWRLRRIDLDTATALLVVFEDVTERDRAEKALRLTQLSVDKSADLIYWIDPAGHLFYVSDSTCQRYGYSREELLTMTIFDLNPAMTPESWAARWMSFEGGGSPTVEAVHKTKQGDLFPTDATVNYVQMDGRTYAFAHARDITDRKRAEEELRRSNDLLTITGQLAKVGGWEFIPETQAVTWTEGVYRIIEVDPATRPNLAEAISFYAPEAQPVISAAVQAAIQTGAPFDLELSVITARGRHIWVRVQGAVERRDGRIVRLYGALQDITERKQAEGEIRQRVADSETVNHISVALRGVSDQEELLRIVLQETLTALNTAHGAISLSNDVTGTLHAMVARGWPSQWMEGPVHPGEGIFGRVFASGDTYVTRDLVNDPWTPPGARAQLPSGWGGACVPIRTREHVLGVLLVAVPSERGLTKDEVRLLNTLAEMTGSALHRMRLHEETERRLGDLQALGVVERAISSSFDLRVILDTVIGRAIAQRGVDAADVLLLHPILQTLEYAAGHGFRTHAIERTNLRLGEGHAGRAALEHRTVRIPNLPETGSQFVRASLLAAEDFVEYHAVPLISKGEVRGVLEMFHRSPLYAPPEWLDFLETLAGQAATAIENAQLFEGMQRSNVELALAYDATIEGWSRALDLRDKETEGHTQRVTEMTLRLARAIGIADTELVHIRRGALLHDIGKMGVPDGILLKPGPLTDEEWVIMRRHPQLAYDLLAPIEYLRPALDIPLCHHERWDGTGYPRGLAGEQISPAARIFAMVDVWDALRSDRPYRQSWTEEKTLEHIRSSAGTHFDPKAVDLFLAIVGEGTERL